MKRASEPEINSVSELKQCVSGFKMHSGGAKTSNVAAEAVPCCFRSGQGGYEWMCHAFIPSKAHRSLMFSIVLPCRSRTMAVRGGISVQSQRIAG